MMLQRAASNAYSWWWASHIRTKQSKWLEQSLQDMEEKVDDTLKIINNDGDSFAQRAEMYYRKRPDLINNVEECYRSYRALAERYDHLSRDLQSANRTIATVYPEQVQFAIDDEDEQNHLQTLSKASDQPLSDLVPNPMIPKVPNTMKDFRSPSMLLSRKVQQLKRNSSSAKAIVPASSGLTKDEALDELDKLQKCILTLQTEREFVKSSYQHGYEKFCELENQITQMQGGVCRLQDEFGIGTAIDDTEARTLMATTALTSCRNTLSKLKQKEAESAGEAKLEDDRVQEAHEKFKALRNIFLPKEQTITRKLSQDINSEEMAKQDLEFLKKKIKQQIEAESNTSLTVTQLAEKIDKLVDKVVNLETAVCAQAALVTRLRTENDELQTNIRNLEDEKESLIQDSEELKNRIKELEEELDRVKSLNRSFKDQSNKLQEHFREADCNIDHLSSKLETVKLDDEVENLGLFQEVKLSSCPKKVEGFENQDSQPNTTADADNSVALQVNSIVVDSEKKHENKEVPETEEELGIEEEDGQPNCRQLFLNNLEDREKLLLEEYSSVLHNFKDVKQKLSDVEKKNRDGFFELAMQMRELKSAIAIRDEEIKLLRQKQGSNIDDHHHWSSNNSNHEGAPESITIVASSPESNLSSLGENSQHPLYDLLGGKRKDSKSYSKDEEKFHQHFNSVNSPIEEKFRTEIDELLEENLEFWLRFSTSFHQIRKFQTSVHDLKAELFQLKDGRRQEGSGKHESLSSIARPIYKHLREIQTELTLWLENNSVMKDEIHGRYESLCNIQEEISRISNGVEEADQRELNEYKAAKYQGEVLNMKQENRKVADELHAGLDRVRGLQIEVDKTLATLDSDFGISAGKQDSSNIKSSSIRARIPLRSFLFGVKLKKQRQQQQKQSLFSCMSPALQKQYSTLASAGLPPQQSG